MIVWLFTLWTLFFLINYAEILRRPVKWARGLMGPKLAYVTECAFCWPFWCTVLGSLVYFDVLLWWVFVVPVLHLFIDLAYHKLLWRPGAPPVMEETK